MRKLKSSSIRFRLTAWYAAILAATSVSAAALVWLTLGHSIRATVDKELRARLDTVRGYVEQEASGEGVTHLREELNEDAVVNTGSAYLRIVDNRGAVIYGSPNAERWPMNILGSRRPPPSGVFQTISVHRKPIRVLTAPVSVGIVQIGLPMDEFREMQQEFLWTILVGTPLLLLIAAAAGYYMSGRALRPVDRIASTAQRITSANLSDRLPYSGAGDELDRLSQILNEMLAGLESSFRRITQFTADASHELRTPLAIIRTTAELIRGRPRTPEEHDRAWASVLTQTERTTQLVNDLLTLTRADSGADPFNFQEADVAAVVAAAVSDMRVLASSKGVELHFAAGTRAVLVGDEEALRRLFTILLDNAVKATPPGGFVDISLALGEDTGDRNVVVTVQDSGVGIAQEHLPHIFDRFYRASKDRSRETGGAGLGLAIAQWIVSAHAGVIQVDSEIGRGAAFRVVLPVPGSMRISFTNPSESANTLKA